MLPEEKLFADIKNLVISARQRAFKAVDSERVLLYWQIGNRINEEILQNQRAEFGKQVVKNLSQKMTLEFGSGFNQINLWLFIRFVTFFPDFEIESVSKVTFWDRPPYIILIHHGGTEVRRIKLRFSVPPW